MSVSVSSYAKDKDGWLCSASFVSPDGYISTAAHCVGTTMEVIYHKDGVKKLAYARLVSIDTEHDVALLKITEHDVPYFSMSDDYQVGDRTVVWGWPNPDKYGMSLKHYKGRILNIGETHIFIYSFVDHGMSGGALTDQDGKAIGVTVAIMGNGAGGENTAAGLATRIEYLQILLASQGVITLPTLDTDSASKMMILLGSN